VDKDLQAEVEKEHQNRLRLYALRRDNEQFKDWADETEMDLDGDQLLAEIKNYKSEKMFGSGLYE
jgi:hypothetical protein